uniref:Uncharacterized protein n=1 Tax=Leptocylindrus danicus TaxID=163516 RepID=A0A7S2LSW7_9STRA
MYLGYTSNPQHGAGSGRSANLDGNGASSGSGSGGAIAPATATAATQLSMATAGVSGLQHQNQQNQQNQVPLSSYLPMQGNQQQQFSGSGNNNARGGGGDAMAYYSHENYGSAVNAAGPSFPQNQWFGGKSGGQQGGGVDAAIATTRYSDQGCLTQEKEAASLNAHAQTSALPAMFGMKNDSAESDAKKSGSMYPEISGTVANVSSSGAPASPNAKKTELMQVTSLDYVPENADPSVDAALPHDLDNIWDKFPS